MHTFKHKRLKHIVLAGALAGVGLASLTLGMLAIDKQAFANDQALLAEFPDTGNYLRAHYTNHPAGARMQTISLRIGSRFRPEELERIQAAVAEWNHVLNGVVVFDLAGPPGAPAWEFVAVAGNATLEQQHGGATPVTFAKTRKAGNDGGSILLYVDRIRLPDLRGVVLHELGGLLGPGVGHDLVSARYNECIGKDEAVQLATPRGLPVDRFNWCETPAGKSANVEESLWDARPRRQ